MLEQNCRLIEQTAIEADSEIYQYLLKAVTQEGLTYGYLKMNMDIPCGKKLYYDRRRKFYWLLSSKKNNLKRGNHRTCQYGILLSYSFSKKLKK